MTIKLTDARDLKDVTIVTCNLLERRAIATVLAHANARAYAPLYKLTEKGHFHFTTNTEDRKVLFDSCKSAALEMGSIQELNIIAELMLQVS